MTDIPRLAAAVDRYLGTIEGAGYSAHTLKAYGTRLSDFVRFCGEDASVAVPADRVQQYLASLRRRPIGRRTGVSAQTLAHAHAVLSGFYRWVERVLGVEPNPLRDVVKPRAETSVDEEFHSLTSDQLDELLHTARDGWSRDAGPPDLRTTNRRWEDHLIVALMGLAGLRVSEVCGLDQGDVDGDVVTVLGKGRKRRTVPLAADILTGLARYVPPRGERHLFALPSNPARRIRPFAIEQRIPRLARRAGIVELRVTPHTLRHTFGSLMLLADPTALIPTRDLMGHESVETTNKYAHTREEARRLALASMHELRTRRRR